MFFKWLVCFSAIVFETTLSADDYNILNPDGSYQFGYNNPDSYHHSQANRNNVVRGEFGGRNPGTGGIDTVQYTAGPRGFRPRGKNIARKYDLSQIKTGPIGSRDDPYFDPNEDPSYKFAFRTRTYSKEEASNRVGDVSGKYTYLDDVGERHNVEYIAGKNTGFHVKSPVPDNKPLPFGPLHYVGKGRPVPRGRSTVQRGLDGSYRFVSGGPDHRRTETSDSTGHVRGSYTYLDDKGVRHSVHYIAGPETGYRVLKNVKGPHLPTIYPFGRPEIVPPDFYDFPNAEDVFDIAESGRPIKPAPGGPKPPKPLPGADDFDFGNEPSTTGNTGGGGGGSPSGSGSGSGSGGGGGGSIFDDFDKPGSTGSEGSFPGFGDTSKPNRPSFGGSRPNKPSYEDDGFDDLGDIFGGPSKPKPPKGDKDVGTTTSDGGGLFGGTKPPQFGGTKPAQSTGGSTTSDSDKNTSKPNKPNYNDNASNDLNDFSIFGDADDSDLSKPSGSGVGGAGTGGTSSSGTIGSTGGGGGGGGSSNNRPSNPSGGGGGGTHIGISGIGPSASGPSGSEGGTLVTNLGDRLFVVPPGISVRAHVQAIDLLPLGPRSPSPSDQLRAESQEISSNLEELKSEASNTSTTVSLPPTNSTEPIPL